jgi:hypothetical protein
MGLQPMITRNDGLEGFFRSLFRPSIGEVPHHTVLGEVHSPLQN